MMLSGVLQREPTDEELADEVGIPLKKLRLLLESSQRMVALDAPINDGEDTSFGDIIGDEHAADPFESLSDKNIFSELPALLDILPPREKIIVEMRFGLNGYEREFTLEEVGAKFGLTRERIRQLQNMALARMKKKFTKKEK